MTFRFHCWPALWFSWWPGDELVPVICHHGIVLYLQRIFPPYLAVCILKLKVNWTNALFTCGYVIPLCKIVYDSVVLITYYRPYIGYVFVTAVSVCDKTSFCKIPRSLKASWSVFSVFGLLWNLSGVRPHQLLLTCLPKFTGYINFIIQSCVLEPLRNLFDNTCYRNRTPIICCSLLLFFR